MTILKLSLLSVELHADRKKEVEAMLKRVRSLMRKFVHQFIRKLISWLPRKQRFEVYRSFADCNPAPSQRLLLKIAETKEEL